MDKNDRKCTANTQAALKVRLMGKLGLSFPDLNPPLGRRIYRGFKQRV